MILMDNKNEAFNILKKYKKPKIEIFFQDMGDTYYTFNECHFGIDFEELEKFKKIVDNDIQIIKELIEKQIEVLNYSDRILHLENILFELKLIGKNIKFKKDLKFSKIKGTKVEKIIYSFDIAEFIKKGDSDLIEENKDQWVQFKPYELSDKILYIRDNFFLFQEYIERLMQLPKIEEDLLKKTNKNRALSQRDTTILLDYILIELGKGGIDKSKKSRFINKVTGYNEQNIRQSITELYSSEKEIKANKKSREKIIPILKEIELLTIVDNIKKDLKD